MDLINKGKLWTKEEETLLLNEIKNKNKFDIIAVNHKRTIGSISAKSKKLIYDMHLKNMSIDEIVEILHLDCTFISEAIEQEKIYSQNKSIPSESIKKNLAKINNIPSNDIDLWFEWIESNYEYLLLKNEISKINEIIKLKEISYDMNTKYFIIKKPIINETN